MSKKNKAPASHPVSVPFVFGTLTFESASDARKALGCFTYGNRVVAQVLSDELQDPKSADAEKVCALGYLNRDIAELMAEIEGEIGGIA